MSQPRDSGLSERIERMIAPAAESMGYDLVRVLVSTGGRPVLQVMAERKDRAPMTHDDCAVLSQTVSALLDVEDPMPGAYDLEVSSPGIDRPLVKRDDFERFAGYEARIETRRPVDGRKRFRGRLIGVEGDAVRIVLPEGEWAVPLDAIHRAKLVLTEDLLAGPGRSN